MPGTLAAAAVAAGIVTRETFLSSVNAEGLRDKTYASSTLTIKLQEIKFDEKALVDGAGANRISDPAGGLLAPGASTTTALSTDAANTRLSVVAMLLPTNDGFVGLPAMTIPTTPGTYTWTLNGYDAGTEANDELITGGGAPGVAGIPADPGGAEGSNGTGVGGPDVNDSVHVHRGNLGDSDLNGGSSDLDSRVHRWLNPVARIVVTVN